jgi:serine-type D-Ala-D-Ala carboxypeptidase
MTFIPVTSPLIAAYEAQDWMFASALTVLDEAIEQQAFPGAAFAVTYQGRLVARRGRGRFSYAVTSPPVTADTIYDLASVTKVVATTAAAMVLYERGMLNLDSPLVQVVPEFGIGSPYDIAGARRQDVNLRMLLAHASGLPAYARLFERASGRRQMLDAACSLPLEAIPGTRSEYSDVGFILLGEALTRLAGSTLDTFCAREVFRPLGMSHTCFRPGAEVRAQIPPTEISGNGETIQGEVQDENARAFGSDPQAGIANAGHAGLFAPAADVAAFAECMLRGGAPILRPETVESFTRRELSPPDTSRALGWDTPSTPSQSGKYFSSRSFGHLGYTGTSLWIDPERGLSVALLTNRTWPDRQSQQIKQVRPRFHDAVVEALTRLR